MPLLVLLGFVLSVVHPAIEEAVTSWTETGTVAWAELGKEALLGLVGALNPLFLMSTVVCFVAAYLITAIIVWSRQLGRLERALVETEKAAAAAATEFGAAKLLVDTPLCLR